MTDTTELNVSELDGVSGGLKWTRGTRNDDVIDKRAETLSEGGRRVAVLAMRLPLKTYPYVTWINAGRRPDAYAHDLYSNLRALDKAGCEQILVQDVPEGEIYQGTGELGFFSPHSWWPLFLALAAGVAAIGVAIGWWLFLIGMLMVLLATVGFVFEYYRGHYAH